MDSAYKLHFDRYLRLPETLRPERFRETLRPTHDRNSEVWISLVEERVPVMDRPAMESRLQGSVFGQGPPGARPILRVTGALRRPRRSQSDATGPLKWQVGLKNGLF